VTIDTVVTYLVSICRLMSPSHPSARQWSARSRYWVGALPRDACAGWLRQRFQQPVRYTLGR